MLASLFWLLASVSYLDAIHKSEGENEFGQNGGTDDGKIAN